MNLTAPEKETIIRYDEDSDRCIIYTCSRPVMTKLDHLCKSQPNTYKLIRETDISKTYETDKSLISFRIPKTISEEHRQKLSENAKKRFGKSE